MSVNLDKLEKLERAATKGPWVELEPDDYSKATGNSNGINGPDNEALIGTNCAVCPPSHADAALIVALRNNAPAMIAELRALCAEVEGLRAALELSARTLTNSTIGYAATEQELMNVRAQLATAREDFVVVCPCCGESYSAKTTKGGGA